MPNQPLWRGFKGSSWKKEPGEGEYLSTPLALIDLITNPVFVVSDETDQIEYANEAAIAWVGLPRSKALGGENWREIVTCEASSRVESSGGENRVQPCAAQDEGPWFEARSWKVDASMWWIINTTSPEKGQYQKDALTSLATRAALSPQLSMLRNQRRSCALLFVDLNEFKRVNDSHGHLLGDLVLHEVAMRLQSALRSDDLLVRYGGDEFVVLAADVSEEEDAAGVAKRLEDSLRMPIKVDGLEIPSSASVGWAVDRNGKSLDSLLRLADERMFAARGAVIRPR